MFTFPVGIRWCGLFVVAVLTACGGGAFDIPDYPEPDPGPFVREAPQIVLAENGKATCIWLGDGHVYAERFIPGAGWTDYVRVDAAPAPVSPPQIATDAIGAATVVWTEDDQVVVNRFVPGPGWGTPEPISAPIAGGVEPEPTVGASDTGDVVVVWTEDGDVMAASFDPVDGWAPPSTVATPLVPAQDVEVAVAPSGDAIAAWEEGGVVVVSSFDADTTTWTPPEPVGAGVAPVVACDGSGDGVVVFQDAGELMAAEHDEATGWQPATSVPVPPAIETVPHGAPDVALSSGGQGVVSFTAANETYVAEYDTDVGFQVAEPVAPGVGVGSTPEVAVDDEGNAVVVFEDDTGDVQVVQYQETYDAWLPPEDHGSGNTPVVDANDGGQAIVIFTEPGSISAIRYADLDPTTPLTLRINLSGSGRVTSDPPAIDCYPGAPNHLCEILVPAGETIQLVATPAPGYRFEQWQGGSFPDPTNPVVDLLMDSDTELVALFVPDL